MSDFNTANEILDFAINEEEQAATFYRDLAKKMDNPAMQKAFEDFAKEEDGHKAKLQKVKQGKQIATSTEEVMNLKIADYLLDVDTSPNMDYQKALILAMKKEKSAFKLYSDLAAKMTDDNLRNLFLGLAQEEAKHKLRFEIEYDEHYLTEM